MVYLVALFLFFLAMHLCHCANRTLDVGCCLAALGRAPHPDCATNDAFLELSLSTCAQAVAETRTEIATKTLILTP